MESNLATHNGGMEISEEMQSQTTQIKQFYQLKYNLIGVYSD